MQRRQMFTDEAVTDAVASSKSLLECFKKLGDTPSGAAYRHLNKRIAELQLDTSHMLGQGHLLGGEPINKIPTSEMFLLDNVKSSTLRVRLVTEGFKEEKCEWCGIEEWRGLPAPLELDHIDGNHSNNALENLRILCANCHSQTPTFRGRKIGKVKPA